jgi:uncharacterized membrane protein YhaH (DUF805 family)
MSDESEPIFGVKSEDGGNCAQDISSTLVAEPGVWSFQGRIGRATFWVRLILANVLAVIAGMMISAIISSQDLAAAFAGLLVILGFVALIWFALALQVKRWHDLDFSGWMVLLNFTFIAIPFTFIYLGFFKGTEGPNRFGADPSEIAQRELAEAAREREHVISWADAARYDAQMMKDGREAELSEKDQKSDPE